MTTHDKISIELALRQLPLVTATDCSDGMWSARGAINELADAINHARLTGSAQMLLEVNEASMKEFRINTAFILKALALPDEKLDCSFLQGDKHLFCQKGSNPSLRVVAITRTTKNEEQPSVSADAAP